MASTTLQAGNLGFFTVQREPTGYVGGLLVTNRWGRPLEFRLSSPVLPNKVQQILYGATLEPYLYSDLIGKKLIEKLTTPMKMVFTDQPAALDLRLHVAMPVALVQNGAVAEPQSISELLEQLGTFDLSDPFVRIREALAEARKLGVSNRAA